MQNLDVVVTQVTGKIECNFDEIKNALQVQMSAYNDVVVSEGEIAKFKDELATLRKIRKAVDDKRKAVKKEFNKPLDEFEDKVKELLAEIDKPIELIDTQIKMFDEERILKKQERCKEIFAEQIGEYGDYISYDSVAKKQWNNVSYSETDIRYDISEAITKVKSDLEVIKSLNSEIESEVLETYKASDLATAIKRNSQYLADKERLQAIEEAKKAEIKEESKPASLQALDHIANVSKMVHFIVSAEDAENVREMLSFANITFREE